MEIYVINTGYMKMKSGFNFFPALEFKSKYPVLVFLIKAGGKTILFDTGLSYVLENKLGIFEKFLSLEDLQNCALDRQLNLLNMNAGHIDYVINSHLHYDHCSSNHLFKGRPILVQKNEYLHFKNSRKNPKKNPMYIEVSGEEEDNFVFVEGDHNIVQDGIAIRLHGAYGHSKGHQILSVEDKDNFLLFLADSCYIKDHTLYPIEVEDDKSYHVSLKTITQINRLLDLKRDKKCRIFISHDFSFKEEGKQNCVLIHEEIEKYVFY